MSVEVNPNVEGFEAGRRLRQTRERQGFTLKRVEELTEFLAKYFNNPEFSVPSSRLSDIETKGVVPSIYRLHALARIYRLNPDHVLEWYGIPRTEIADVALPESPVGRFAHIAFPDAPVVPMHLDPLLKWESNFEVARVIEQWGAVPFAVLQRFQRTNYLYAYVGLEDYRMSPILPPGSFVQIDPSKTRISRSGWNNDYERPVYAIDTREGLLFSWCSIVERRLLLESHPLSKCEIEILKVDEVDILGQVVGAAIRLGGQASSLSIVRERP